MRMFGRLRMILFKATFVSLCIVGGSWLNTGCSTVGTSSTSTRPVPTERTVDKEYPNGYPVGIYSPGAVTNYGLLHEVGFSHIFAGASKETLDAAQRAGLKVIATPGQSATKNIDYKGVWRTVRQADKHPALCAWYLIDEPDFSKTDPVYVQALQDYLQQKAVRKPTALVTFKGYETADYAQIPDILLLDRYPIGWQPIETFGKHLRLARYAAGPDKPLWAVIQAFDWSYYPSVWAPVGETSPRPPTQAELRNMTWTALALGANGLFYYCYENKNAWKMEEHPQTWADLKQVVAEVRAFEPLFTAQQVWYPKQIVYLNSEQGFNAVQEPAIMTAKLCVGKGNKILPAGEYLLCVNTTEETVPYKIALPGIHSGLVYSRNISSIGGKEVYPVSHSTARDGWVIEQLEPLQVRVYGPLNLY